MNRRQLFSLGGQNRKGFTVAGARFAGCRRRGFMVGFTLLELLLAVVIFSAGVVAVMEAYAVAVNAAAAAADALQADGLLREKAAELEAPAQSSAFDAAEGIFSSTAAAYQWRVASETVSTAPALRACTISVWRSGDAQPRGITTWILPADMK
jgi:type II secretion system protein I